MAKQKQKTEQVKEKTTTIPLSYNVRDRLIGFKYDFRVKTYDEILTFLMDNIKKNVKR